MAASTTLAEIKTNDAEKAAAEIADEVAAYCGASGLDVDVAYDDVNSTATNAIFTVTITDNS